ncbi:MAG: hypothetical protein ACTHJX_03455 [Terriglobales bacterium]
MSAPQSAVFVPTAAQRRLLDYVDAHPGLKTIQELCAGAGVPSSTYYHWCKNTDFRLWFAASWSARLTMDGVTLLNQARLLASRNFSYWKALFNLTFDPKGFAMLQAWQQAAAQLPADAFTTAPEPPPAPANGVAPTPAPAPPKRELIHSLYPPHQGATPSAAGQSRLQSPPESNQPLTDVNWRKSVPTPMQHVRTLRKALR